MSAHSAASASAHYGTIVVIGGGCYGSYYVRQLGRASRAGAITWDRVLVVDRNPDCLVATNASLDESERISPSPTLITADWSEFLGDYLSRWTDDRSSRPTDSIVPSPLMPHLLYEWVRDRAKERWPGRTVQTVSLDGKPDTPWQSAAPDGTHYASFATWTCPVNCIEPEICPHTRSERSWTMPKAMEDYVAAERRAGRAIEGPLVFHCTHRAFGVGMIPVSAVVEGDVLVAQTADKRAARFVVATVSHCHGAMNVLSVD
ncbi:MAG TPA: hypothetical protein VFC35_01555 [Gemmatimonadaceae bacterium]|nr:hypothetical protein [Gemmatimonadaceae bacterium]